MRTESRWQGARLLRLVPRAAQRMLAVKMCTCDADQLLYQLSWLYRVISDHR